MSPSTTADVPSPFIAKTMRTHLGALLLLGFVLAIRAHGQTPTLADGLKTAVLRTDEARIYTILHQQTGALADLMTDDCLYTHASGRVQTRAEFVAAIASGNLVYRSFRYDAPPAIRIYNNHTGILTGVARVDVESKATGKLSLHLVITSTYVAQGGQWKLASYHSAAAPAEG